jgi:hypothetical protein
MDDVVEQKGRGWCVLPDASNNGDGSQGVAIVCADNNKVEVVNNGYAKVNAANNEVVLSEIRHCRLP